MQLNQTALHLSPPKLPSLTWSPSGTLTLLTNPPHSHAILAPMLTPPIPSTPFSIHLVPAPPPPPPSGESELSDDSESDDEDAVPAGVYSLAAKQGIESFGFGEWSFTGVGGRKGGRRPIWCAGANSGRVTLWEGVGEGWKGRVELGEYLRDGEPERSREGKLKGRGIACAWSKPCYGFRQDGWPEGLLAVSNDAGEIVFFEIGEEGTEDIKVKGRHVVKRLIVPATNGIRSSSPKPKSRHVETSVAEDHFNLSHEESLALSARFVDCLFDYTGHLDDIPKRALPERLVKSPVEHLTWSPWMEDGEDRWALLACSFMDEVIIMKVTMKRDGGVVASDQRTVGKAWTDKHKVLNARFFDEVLSGYCVLAYAVQMEVRILFIPVSTPFSAETPIIIESHSNTFHEPINAMTFLRHLTSFALLFYTHLGNSQLITFPVPLLTTNEGTPSHDPSLLPLWTTLDPPFRNLSAVLENDLANYQITNDAKYALHNIYGIATSTMGGIVALAYRTTPDYCLTYTMAAEERTKFIFATGTPPDDLLELWFPVERTEKTEYPAPNPYTLPSESFLLELSYLNFESTMKFRKRLPRKPPQPFILPVQVDKDDVVGSLARNILEDQTLSRVRYRQLLNFTPSVCVKYGVVFGEAREAAWREWGILIWVVANILSIPIECLQLEPLRNSNAQGEGEDKPYIEEGPNRRCFYAISTLALLTFYKLPRLLPLIRTAFEALELPYDSPEFQLLQYRLLEHHSSIQPQKSGNNKKPSPQPLPPLPNGYTPPTATSFESRYERCRVCGDALLAGDLLLYKCSKRGHRVQRCQITFLPIREVDVNVSGQAGGGDGGKGGEVVEGGMMMTGRRECGICGRHVRGIAGKGEVERGGLVVDLLKAWDVCVYCGGMFVS